MLPLLSEAQRAGVTAGCRTQTLLTMAASPLQWRARRRKAVLPQCGL